MPKNLDLKPQSLNCINDRLFNERDEVSKLLFIIEHTETFATF